MTDVADVATARPMEASVDSSRPSILSIFANFLRLGATAFAGAGNVVYIEEMAVEQKGWLDRETYRGGVALAQSLPGAIAMHAAAYVGLRLRGLVGALAAYVGFGIPAFLLMLILSAVYQRTHSLPALVSLFAGLRVIVVALIANAAVGFGRSAIKSARDVAIALVAAAIFGLRAGNPALVIALAGLAGSVMLRGERSDASVPAAAPGMRSPWRWAAELVAAGGLVLVLLYMADRTLFSLAVTMMRIDLLAFGGGFTSVPLMQHDFVDVHRWMDARTFMDGIVLGQATPGPIVITATFAGYMVRGIAGAVVGTAAVFFPSLVLVVLAAPHFDSLKSSPAFQGAIRGVLFSLVGLLAVVTLRFAVATPWTPAAIVLGAGAFVALLRKVDVLWVVLVGGIFSLVLMH